jgi:hypothetical protein
MAGAVGGGGRRGVEGKLRWRRRRRKRGGGGACGGEGQAQGGAAA